MKKLRIIMILASFLIMISITVNMLFIAGKNIPKTGIYIDAGAMAILLLGVVITHLSKSKEQ